MLRITTEEVSRLVCIVGTLNPAHFAGSEDSALALIYKCRSAVTSDGGIVSLDGLVIEKE